MIMDIVHIATTVLFGSIVVGAVITLVREQRRRGTNKTAQRPLPKATAPVRLKPDERIGSASRADRA